MTFIGILVIGVGVLMLVARDFFWALTEMSNSFSGRTSERTELWEAGQMISGVILIILGAVVSCVGIGEAREQEAARVAPTETAVAAQSLVEALTANLSEQMPRWEASASPIVQHVEPSSVSVDASDIYYGLCADGRFFVAVYRLGQRYGEDYIYLTEGTPHHCNAQGVRVYGDSRSVKEGWWTVDVLTESRIRLPDYSSTMEAILTPSSTATPTHEPAPTRTPQAAPTPEATPTPQFV